MAFWTNGLAPEPKRQFRFKVIIAALGADGGTWYATKATKPAFTVTESGHKFLNHTFYYPGKVEWNKVTISFVDPTNPDATGEILQVLRNSGYNVPANISNDVPDLSTIGKASSVGAVGSIEIYALNDKGAAVEKWVLNSPWISGITMNDYDYSADELSTIDVEFRYDWASFINAGMAGGASDDEGGGKKLFTLGDATPATVTTA